MVWAAAPKTVLCGQGWVGLIRRDRDLRARRRRGFWAGYASATVSKNLRPVSD